LSRIVFDNPKRGAHLNPMRSEKSVLRLAEHLDAGHLSGAGTGALVQAVARAKAAATLARCEEVLAFATSALGDAENSVAALERVRAETGVVLQILPVGCQNAVVVLELRFQAAVSYSLRRPPRIVRRRILPWIGSGTGDVGHGGRNWSARCGRRWL
jgi:hypothetical protein